MHTLTEFVTQENFITNLLGSKVAELGHAHGIPTGTGLFGIPIAWGTSFIYFVWIFPMVWYFLYKKKALLTLLPEQQVFEKRYTRLVGWFFIETATLLIIVFGYFLPHMFDAHWSKMGQEEEMPMEDHMMQKPGIKESNFHVTLSSLPSAVQAGRPFTLKITLHDKAGRPIRDLQVSHERILHVILVSEDLEEFKHVHPEDAKNYVPKTGQNEFEIPLTLSKAGRYRVLIDGFREGIGEVYDVVWLQAGDAKTAVTIKKDPTRDKIFDGYRVMLRTDPNNLISGKESHLNYYIEKDGSSVSNTEQYLGADMHLAIMSIDLSTMIHTHGLRSKSAKENPLGEIDAHYTFPFPGLWKIYGQFQHLGKVITTEFMLEVAPGANQMDQPQMHMDNHGQ